MVHIPGGDWHPGWGVDPMYTSLKGCRNVFETTPFIDIFEIFVK